MSNLQNESWKRILNRRSKKAWGRYGLRYKRLLGMGGHGIAALYELKKPDDRVVECVVKMAIMDDRATELAEGKGQAD